MAHIKGMVVMRISGQVKRTHWQIYRAAYILIIFPALAIAFYNWGYLLKIFNSHEIGDREIKDHSFLGRYGLYSGNRYITAPIFQDLYHVSDGLIRAKAANRWGYLDKKGIW